MLKKLRLGISFGVAILVIDAAIPLLLAHRTASMRVAADATDTTGDHLAELLSAYKDAETGQRGFMLTGKRDFLQPYTSGRATVERLLPLLKIELQIDPKQTQRFSELLALDQREEQFQQQRIALRSDTNWLDLSASEHGRQLMGGLRTKIAEISAVERERGEALIQRVGQLELWSHISLAVITALDLILFAVLFFVAIRSMRAELAAKESLTELNKNLANEITLRTEALSLLEQQSDRLKQIVRMQAALAETQLDIDTFMKKVVELMLVLTSATGAVIEMIDNQEMVYTATSGTIANFIGLRLQRRGSLSGLCVETGEVMIAADTSTDPRVDRAACKKVGAASMIVAPLLRAGEGVGVLKVTSDKAYAFDESAVQTLRLMAGFLGAALGNQQQFQKTEALLAERSITLSALKRELRRREEYEQKLLLQQETLHAITNAIPALVSLLDANECYRYCNDEYTKTFGVAVEKIIGLTSQQFVGDAMYDVCKPYIDRALAGESVVYERTMPTITGLRHQECRHIPQFDAEGKPDGFYLIAWDITERKAQEIEWQARASIDELTKLLNRASFSKTLDLMLSHHAHTKASIAVLYLDVDRFKHINDTYGHAAGDTLLKAFASYLKLSVRQSDVVGRLGGDEFCIVLDDIQTPANAIAVAEKILTTARTPIAFDNHTLIISTSIGIAFAPQPGIHSEQLIALADTALYKAKQAGRNRYVLDVISSASETTNS